MKCIIADTSSILFALSNKVDPFEALSVEFPQARLIVSKGILRELSGIGGSAKKQAAHAKVALSLIKKRGITVDKSDAYPDIWIARAAKAYGCLVCTNDGKLKKALRLKGIRAFSISKDGKAR